MTVATPRVLLISESRITRRVVEMSFADQQIELIIAGNSQDGLAAWADQPAAVVLADLTTDAPPDGLALARHVHAHANGRHVAVLLMAGQSETVDDAELADAGVRSVLRKPLDSMQLVEAVRNATRAERAVVAPEAPQAPWPAASLPTVVDAAAVAEVAAAFEVAPGAIEAPRLAADDAPEPSAPLAAPDLHEQPHVLRDEDLERVAERVAAIWSGQTGYEGRVTELLASRAEQATTASALAAVERVAPEATSAAAERLVRELAPALVAEVARLVVADVSERLVREEIARMRAEHAAR